MITLQFMKNKNFGKIYILRNSSYKDTIVKIGRTSRISEIRAKEISVGTGVPNEFEVLYEEDVFDCVHAEKIIHEILNDERINPQREFFRVSLKKAVKLVFDTCLRVNRKFKKNAGTRIVIVLGSSMSWRNIRKVREILLNHKGRKIEVYLLFDTKSGKRVIIKAGKNMNVVLSPILITALNNIRGVKDVFWISNDLKQIADFDAMEKVKPVAIDWEN